MNLHFAKKKRHSAKCAASESAAEKDKTRDASLGLRLRFRQRAIESLSESGDFDCEELNARHDAGVCGAVRFRRVESQQSGEVVIGDRLILLVGGAECAPGDFVLSRFEHVLVNDFDVQMCKLLPEVRVDVLVDASQREFARLRHSATQFVEAESVLESLLGPDGLHVRVVSELRRVCGAELLRLDAGRLAGERGLKLRPVGGVDCVRLRAHRHGHRLML